MITVGLFHIDRTQSGDHTGKHVPTVNISPAPISTLREFLDAFFEEYDVADMLIAETEAEATAHGWASIDGDPPGTWKKNSEGEQTCAFARVTVNGQFNEYLDGLDTELEDGDRVALMYPFVFCF
ncbi:MAG: MoaD/ThiS family protein [Halapricum sp.]